jgi:hypothetical protein
MSSNRDRGVQGFEIDLGEKKLWVASVLSGRTAEPIVEIQLGEESAQMPAEASDLVVLHLLQASAASLNDAFLYEFFSENGVKPEQIVGMLAELREFRNKRWTDFLAGVQRELTTGQ